MVKRKKVSARPVKKKAAKKVVRRPIKKVAKKKITVKRKVVKKAVSASLI